MGNGQELRKEQSLQDHWVQDESMLDGAFSYTDTWNLQEMAEEMRKSADASLEDASKELPLLYDAANTYDESGFQSAALALYDPLSDLWASADEARTASEPPGSAEPEWASPFALPREPAYDPAASERATLGTLADTLEEEATDLGERAVNVIHFGFGLGGQKRPGTLDDVTTAIDDGQVLLINLPDLMQAAADAQEKLDFGGTDAAVSALADAFELAAGTAHVDWQFAAIEREPLSAKVMGPLALKVGLPRAPQFLRDRSLEGAQAADTAWEQDAGMMADLAEMDTEATGDPLLDLDDGLSWLVHDSPVVDASGAVNFTDTQAPMLAGPVTIGVTTVLKALANTGFDGAQGGGLRATLWRTGRAWLLSSLDFRAEEGVTSDGLEEAVWDFIDEADELVLARSVDEMERPIERTLPGEFDEQLAKIQMAAATGIQELTVAARGTGTAVNTVMRATKQSGGLMNAVAMLTVILRFQNAQDAKEAFDWDDTMSVADFGRDGILLVQSIVDVARKHPMDADKVLTLGQKTSAALSVGGGVLSAGIGAYNANKASREGDYLEAAGHASGAISGVIVAGAGATALSGGTLAGAAVAGPVGVAVSAVILLTVVIRDYLHARRSEAAVTHYGAVVRGAESLGDDASRVSFLMGQLAALGSPEEDDSFSERLREQLEQKLSKALRDLEDSMNALVADITLAGEDVLNAFGEGWENQVSKLGEWAAEPENMTDHADEFAKLFTAFAWSIQDAQVGVLTTTGTLNENEATGDHTTEGGENRAWSHLMNQRQETAEAMGMSWRGRDYLKR